MSAPEQQAAPEQPPADLHQRLLAAIEADAYRPRGERRGLVHAMLDTVQPELAELAALRQQLANVRLGNSVLDESVTELRESLERSSAENTRLRAAIDAARALDPGPHPPGDMDAEAEMYDRGMQHVIRALDNALTAAAPTT